MAYKQYIGERRWVLRKFEKNRNNDLISFRVLGGLCGEEFV